MDDNRTSERIDNTGAVVPDCGICGQKSTNGDPCEACKAAKMRGYDLSIDEVSGSKTFTDWATWHFYSGYRAGAEAQRERDAAIAKKWADSPSCQSHEDNPCCHVRTGQGIYDAIRSAPIEGEQE